MIGKPYSGEPNVRFDEGELEIEPSATTPVPYSTLSVLISGWQLYIKNGISQMITKEFSLTLIDPGHSCFPIWQRF